MSADHLLARGREADVFAAGGGRVLRRYRDGSDATTEAEVMRHVRRHGYPAPEVHGADGPDLVLDRLDGPTMAEALAAGALDLDDGARTLASLHQRLHAIPPWAGGRDGDRVLHLDLHPENVMVTAGGPVVIDWTTAEVGPPDLDVALSALILAQVAVDAGDPRARPAGLFLTAFVAAVDDNPVTRLDAAVARRRANPTMTAGELDRMDAAAALVRATAATRHP